jgi:hypothetical protein
MLFYYQDKPLRTRFGKILEGVVKFLDLCHPSSREVQRVFLRHWPGGDRKKQVEESAVFDGSASSKLKCEELFRVGCEKWKDPSYAVYVAWKPTAGPSEFDVPVGLGHQLTITQSEPQSDRSWAFVYLPTSFDVPDDRFQAWLSKANDALPFLLQESRWRTVHISKAGKPVLRKVRWS